MSDDSINPAQIRGAFTVMTLLGITWVFGPFAINEAKVVINYIFTVLNSLQGFLIFVFRCCFNPEVRSAWILLIKTGKFKRRKGPVTAYTSDTSSSKGDSKGNGSYNDTVKSHVFRNSLSKPRHLLNDDRSLDIRNTNSQSKSSKDFHPYYDDLNKQKVGNPRKFSSSADDSRLYRGTDRNGHSHRNPGCYDNENGVTTIYTGRHNGVRRISGYIAEKDEFTRL